MVETALVVFLALYNNVANLIPAFNGRWYVPINSVAAALVLAIGLGPLDLNLYEVGLSRMQAGDFALGLVLGFALTMPLFAALRWPRTTALIADRRVAGLSGAELAYQTLLRIPVGTALLEEVAFRGVLFGALRPHGAVFAAIVSSLVFGLWHISPTVNLVRANRPRASTTTIAGAVFGAIGVTALAGLLLCWLRVEGDGLLLPWAAHATLNASATVAGALAHRRLADRQWGTAR